MHPILAVALVLGLACGLGPPGWADPSSVLLSDWLPTWRQVAPAADDERPPPGGNIVVNSTSAGLGINITDYSISLYEALHYAEADAQPNTITFSVTGWLNVGGAGPDTSWDITSQGDKIVGASGGGTPKVGLTDGLDLRQCRNFEVRGLGFNSVLQLNKSSYCTVAGCTFGFQLNTFDTVKTDSAAHLNLASNAQLPLCTNNTIGGAAADRNHFANAYVYMSGPGVLENTFCNNYLGLRGDGVTPVSPLDHAYMVIDNEARGNRVGAALAPNWFMGAGTLLSIRGQDTDWNIVRGNYFGAAGAAQQYSTAIEIADNASGNLVGGPVTATFGPNVILGHTSAGVVVRTGCHNTQIRGTHIGVDKSGALRSFATKPSRGIVVEAGADWVMIGDEGSGEGNWVGGHTAADVVVGTNTAGGTPVNHLYVQGNRLGMQAVTNGYSSAGSGSALVVYNGDGVTIGGATTGGATPGNFVGGCQSEAVKLYWCSGVVQSNRIGLAPTGIGVANQKHGVFAYRCTDLTIGGGENDPAAEPPDEGPPSSTRGNAVMYGDSGVYLSGCEGITIQGNLIGSTRNAAFSNRGYGIAAMDDCESLTIGGLTPTKGNRIAQNRVGLQIQKTVGPINVYGNHVFGSRTVSNSGGYGVYMYGPVSNVTLYGNTIEGSARAGVGLNGSSAEVKGVTIGPTTAERSPNTIISNGDFGVEITGANAHGNKVVGNWIGVVPTNANETVWEAKGNTDGGVLLGSGAYENVIGQSTAVRRNSICGNEGPGVKLTGGAHHNRLIGNTIGRLLPTSGAVGNKDGVVLNYGAHDNTIGGASITEANWVAGNRSWGIDLDGSGTDNNLIRWCFVGVNGSSPGTPKMDGNAFAGIRIRGGAQRNKIGESSPTEYAVVVAASQSGAGIEIDGGSTTHNKVSRCRVGTIPTGAACAAGWGNVGPGVELSGGAQFNDIGGPSAGNQIANNKGPGVLIEGSGSDNNTLCANLIGLTNNGQAALENRGEGVRIIGGAKNRIGLTGQGQASGNTISGNTLHGVYIEGDTAKANVVAHCVIGLDKDGADAVPNGQTGVTLAGGVQLTDVGPGNVISANTGSGVVMFGPNVNDNELKGSTIGLNKAKTAFRPNSPAAGTSMTAVAIRELIGSSGPRPARNLVADNWIFGQGRGIYFGSVTPPGSHAAAPTEANRALRNKIGFTQPGGTHQADIGILAQESEVYLEQNEIAGHNIGVQGVGTAAFPILNRCNLRNNKTHVQLSQNAKGYLGKAGQPPEEWDHGANVFGPHPALTTGCYALHLRDTPTNYMCYAENCDWGTTSEAAIKKRIRYRDDDTEKWWVDFSPVLGGATPTGDAQASIVIGGASASPTAAGVEIGFVLSAPADVTVEVLNIAARPVATVVPAHPAGPGLQRVTWNRLSTHGTRAPAGRYLVRVTARDIQGAQSSVLTAVTLR